MSFAPPSNGQQGNSAWNPRYKPKKDQNYLQDPFSGALPPSSHEGLPSSAQFNGQSYSGTPPPGLGHINRNVSRGVLPNKGPNKLVIDSSITKPNIRKNSSARTTKRRSQLKRISVLVIGVSIVLLSIVGFFVYQAVTEDIFETTIFPEENRNNNNFIGVLFINRPTEETFIAFDSAANRWSQIIAGSEQLLDTTVVLQADQSLCAIQTPNELGFDVVLDHLRIIASFPDIDDVGGILGSANSCRVSGSGISVTALMEFDEADVLDLAAKGELEAVILHEMAHTLGIGSDWQNFDLVSDLVGLPTDTIQPKYNGNLGIAQFEADSQANLGFVPVENGFTDGVFAAGLGSFNVHWDQDTFGAELMTFKLQLKAPPISATTIASLQDIGYVVDLTQADAFSFSVDLVPDIPEEQAVVFENDIYPVDQQHLNEE